MAEIHSLHRNTNTVLMLEEHLKEAKKDNITSLVVIAKNNNGEVYVTVLNGTSSTERAGMCAYAQKIILDSMEEV